MWNRLKKARSKTVSEESSDRHCLLANGSRSYSSPLCPPGKSSCSQMGSRSYAVSPLSLPPATDPARQGLTRTDCSLLHNSSLDLINIFYQRAVKDEAQRWGGGRSRGCVGKSQRAEKAGGEGGGKAVCHVSRPQDRRIYQGFKKSRHFGPSKYFSLFDLLSPARLPDRGLWVAVGSLRLARRLCQITRMTVRSLERILFPINRLCRVGSCGFSSLMVAPS